MNLETRVKKLERETYPPETGITEIRNLVMEPGNPEPVEIITTPVVMAAARRTRP